MNSSSSGGDSRASQRSIRSGSGPRKTYDAFIVHAAADKDAVARPLAERLARRYRVWYDDWSLTVGDSLRQRIEEGLRRSRFGVVILSPRFFERRWPQHELDGLAAREVEGRKVILPVWHDVDHDEVAKRSPMLAGRLAAHTADGIERVAEDIGRVLAPRGPRTPRVPTKSARFAIPAKGSLLYEARLDGTYPDLMLPPFAGSGDPSDSSLDIRPGVIALAITKAGGEVSTWLNMPAVRTFVGEIDVLREETTDQSYFTLYWTVRRNGPTLPIVSVYIMSARGHVRLQLSRDHGESQALTADIPMAEFPSGVGLPDTIAVVVEDRSMSLFVNQQKAAEVADCQLQGIAARPRIGVLGGVGSVRVVGIRCYELH